MGAIEKNIIAQCKRENEPLPERIQNKPRLLSGLLPIFELFWELNTDRPTGFGLGRLGWSLLHEFAKAQGFEGNTYSDFMVIMRQLDNAYLAHMESKNGEPSRSGKKD